MKVTESEIDRSLETKVENENQRVLRKALERMDGGNRWCKHFLWLGSSGAERDTGAVCARGAVNWVLTGDATTWPELGRMNHPAHDLLDRAAGKPAPFLNNNAADFSEVRAMFERAIELAGETV